MYSASKKLREIGCLTLFCVACTDPSHDHDHKGHDHKGHDHQGHDHKEHDHKGHGHSSSSSNGIVVHKTGFKTGVGSGHADPNHVHEVGVVSYVNMVLTF